jgi:hypothetical protein
MVISGIAPTDNHCNHGCLKKLTDLRALVEGNHADNVLIARFEKKENEIKTSLEQNGIPIPPPSLAVTDAYAKARKYVYIHDDDSVEEFGPAFRP